ncbi:MAG TPA: uracil-DNA glycosylase [Terriglobales bacterium]|nr:uracil-DNA glycosylase [Terriglobales bacterium]
MASPLDPQVRRALANRIRYYNDLGIYDFYRRPIEGVFESINESGGSTGPEGKTDSSRLKPFGMTEGEGRFGMTEAVESELQGMSTQSMAGEGARPTHARPTHASATQLDPVAALRAIRENIGDCTRCRLHKQGRKQIVFGVGNPQAELMFIGEAPGADEDQQGEPFVGRAGQLLTNMIKAMGLRREDIYIANIIKCRPPGNRTPERDECETCSPFLMRQIEVIGPKVLVALGAVAAKTLLALNAPMSELRGRWFDFRGTKLAVTYHPAFLLRDPRQKKETWKDLQMVMKELGLKLPEKPAE